MSLGWLEKERLKAIRDSQTLRRVFIPITFLGILCFLAGFAQAFAIPEQIELGTETWLIPYQDVREDVSVPDPSKISVWFDDDPKNTQENFVIRLEARAIIDLYKTDYFADEFNNEEFRDLVYLDPFNGHGGETSLGMFGITLHISNSRYDWKLRSVNYGARYSHDISSLAHEWYLFEDDSQHDFHYIARNQNFEFETLSGYANQYPVTFTEDTALTEAKEFNYFGPQGHFYVINNPPSAYVMQPGSMFHDGHYLSDMGFDSKAYTANFKGYVPFTEIPKYLYISYFTFETRFTDTKTGYVELASTNPEGPFGQYSATQESYRLADYNTSYVQSHAYIFQYDADLHQYVLKENIGEPTAAALTVKGQGLVRPEIDPLSTTGLFDLPSAVVEASGKATMAAIDTGGDYLGEFDSALNSLGHSTSELISGDITLVDYFGSNGGRIIALGVHGVEIAAGATGSYIYWTGEMMQEYYGDLPIVGPLFGWMGGLLKFGGSVIDPNKKPEWPEFFDLPPDFRPSTLPEWYIKYIRGGVGQWPKYPWGWATEFFVDCFFLGRVVKWAFPTDDLLETLNPLGWMERLQGLFAFLFKMLIDLAVLAAIGIVIAATLPFLFAGIPTLATGGKLLTHLGLYNPTNAAAGVLEQMGDGEVPVLPAAVLTFYLVLFILFLELIGVDILPFFDWGDILGF